VIERLDFIACITLLELLGSHGLQPLDGSGDSFSMDRLEVISQWNKVSRYVNATIF